MRDRFWYARLFILAGLVCSYPIALAISPTIAWEDGPLEIFEAAFLLAGLVLALYRMARSSDRAWRGLWLIAGVVWLAMLGRELSWGAVFFSDPIMNEYGPAYSSRDLWYKPYVHPLIAVLVVVALAIAARWRSWTVMWTLLSGRRLPWAAIGLAAIGFAISLVAEGHAGVSTGLSVMISENLEEVAEFCAYLALLVAQEEVALLMA